MEVWIQNIINQEQSGIVLVLAVLFMGAISVFLCACNYTVIGMAAGYTGAIGTSKRVKTVLMNALFFFAGIIISMSVIGGIIGFAGEFLSTTIGSYWKIAAGLVTLFFGLFTLDLLPFKIPLPDSNQSHRKKGIIPSLIFGISLGGLSLACSSSCNPIFAMVIAISFVKGSLMWGILLLLAYAIGYGLTISALTIAAGLGLGVVSGSLKKFGVILKYTAGIALILLGFYFLLTF